MESNLIYGFDKQKIYEARYKMQNNCKRWYLKTS